MSTGAQLREIVRPGTAFTLLWSGSVVLAGMVCRCGGRVLGWAWDVASVDVEATEAAQAKADKAARAKASKAKAKARKAKADQDDDEDDDQEPEDDAEVTAPPVKPLRRPAGEALGLAAFGGLLASGAAGTATTLLWPYVQQLGPYQGVLVTAGVLGWTVAAWTLAPPPTPKNDHESDPVGEEHQEDVEEGQEQAPAPDPGTALLLHVVGALAEAEAAGRVGLHLDVVLASAVAAGLLAEGTEQGEFRTWVEGCGLPTADKVGYRIGGKPVTRVGLRIDAATAALEMSPAALLAARSQALVQTPGETRAAAASAPAPVPTQAVGEGSAEAAAHTPVEAPVPAPAGTPVPAVLRLIPGGLLDPDSAPSPALSQGRAQEAR
ncbi:hypothetical protein ACFWNR_39185 [Streptomyces virginiae]|uniref:hypothetical protein n=1 Tax=Streptomyces virginiae TaxID=1961 RepID=UPI00365F64FF